MDFNNETRLLSCVVIALLLLGFFLKFRQQMQRKQYNYDDYEGFDGSMTLQNAGYSREYDPRSFQPAISKDAIEGDFIPLPTKAEHPWSKNTGNYGETDILDDGASGQLGFNFNMCSKACCSNSQWPAPHSVTPDDYVLMSGKDYVPTTYTCNNSWQDAGCICATPEQVLFLNGRGGNAVNTPQ